MGRIDAFELARKQQDTDEATVRALRGVSIASGEDAHRWLLAKKRQKMSASAFSFFRGSLPFFRAALRATRASIDGAEGEGWIVGDAHAENFGALRIDDGAPWQKGEVGFWINDFDSVTKGPWVEDVLRLATNALLAGASRATRAADSLSWLEAVIDGYLSDAIADIPKPVAGLRKKVEHRSYGDFLAARTEARAKGAYATHEFIRGERYADLDRDARGEVESVARDLHLLYERFGARGYEFARVDDVAFRVAGNGSLGTFRAAISVKPIEPEDPPWLFDLKELSVSAKALTAAREALSAIDVAPAVLSIHGRRMALRPLAPQEDKLSMEKVDTAHFEALFRYLGSVLGAAHHRAQGAQRPRWSRATRASITRAAVELFAAHEAGFLAYSALPS
jgi:uncharacterized protein (DUF2252 family)